MKQGKLIIFGLLTFLLPIGNSSNACTIVSCSMHGEVFAAANEDDFTPFSRIWFNPRTSERYGSVCFGAPDLQVGAAMNEYGLFYDATAQYSIDPTKYHLKNPYYGDICWEIIGKCKTVKEALAYMETREFTATSQVLLADATGHSVVIHIGTKVMKNGNYQINTNFDIDNLATGNYSCGRYDIANQMLSKTKSLSVPFFKTLLDATHQEGELSTQYSNIYDLKRGKIYVYLFHNYEHCYTIDLKKELAKGYRLERLDDHFPKSFAYQMYTQNQGIYKKEEIMSEINDTGLNKTLEKYVTELKSNNIKKDSTLKNALLNVGIQLIKDANNKHQQGAMWDYFFSLPKGYEISPYTDERLTATTKLFNALLQEQWADIKLKNFMIEMLAYIDSLENRKALALEKYQKLALDVSETYPSTNNRSKEMISRLNK